MARPVVHDASEKLYARLPEHYRNADEAQSAGPNGYPLLRFLSLSGDLLGELADLVDRINFLPPDEDGEPGDTSDLVDPDTADASWLSWLAQAVGSRLEAALTEAEARDAIRFAPSGYQVGSRQAIENAAKTALTGTKYARVYAHSSALGAIGGATWDHILVVTLPSETPDPAAVLATIIAKRAKPAGAELHHAGYSASWLDIETDVPTWADIEALGSWANLEAVGI